MLRMSCVRHPRGKSQTGEEETEDGQEIARERKWEKKLSQPFCYRIWSVKTKRTHLIPKRVELEILFAHRCKLKLDLQSNVNTRCKQKRAIWNNNLCRFELVIFGSRTLCSDWIQIERNTYPGNTLWPSRELPSVLPSISDGCCIRQVATETDANRYETQARNSSFGLFKSTVAENRSRDSFFPVIFKHASWRHFLRNRCVSKSEEISSKTQLSLVCSLLRVSRTRRLRSEEVMVDNRRWLSSHSIHWSLIHSTTNSTC